MIPPQRLILLDTSVLVHLIRGTGFGKKVKEDYHLDARPERPVISVITWGEILALAKGWGWGEAKVRQMEDLIRELVIVDINNAATVRLYAEISSYLWRTGKQIQQNDMWVAASVAATDAYLLTTDKDFVRLKGRFIDVDCIDFEDQRC